MFSNKLYALGIFGALALSLQYVDASEDLQAQQTSSSPSSPGKFAQGMNFITSGFKNTFNRVTGGRLFANKEKDAETVVVEVAPSTVSKTTDPSGPEKIESIPLSHAEAPYSPKAEELESKAIYVNENELGVNKVVEIEKIETEEHVQTPPIARVSGSEESRNDQLLVNIDDNTIVVDTHNSPDLHHYDANGGLMQTGPRPIAYPSKLDESGDDVRPHDDSNPLEVIDTSSIHQIQETIYNRDSPEVLENMKHRLIAHLTKSGEEEGDMSLVIDKNDVSDTSRADEEPENMKNRPIAHLTKSREEEGDINVVVDKIDISDTSKTVNVRTNVDELPMPYESGQREFQNYQSLDAGDALKFNGMDYEHENRQYDKSEAFLNADNLHTPKAKLSESNSMAEEDVREYEQKDVSYDNISENPSVAHLSNYEYEVEHDQLLNEKSAIHSDEVPHTGDMSASERTTSIVDSSILEVLKNKSLESEEKIIIHQDSSRYDSDARVSPNLMVPIADNSDMAEENGALAYTDLSRMRELENVSPEDTFQPLINNIPHIGDTFASERTTSIVDSSKLDEELKNESLEFEGKVFIRPDTSHYDGDARISPNLMIPIADNSDMAEENGALASADLSRMRELENVSPEDISQPLNNVPHIGDTFTSERMTSIVDSSKLDEKLENKSLEFEEKVIIRQDSSRYDSDARISPNLVVPVADSSDMAEENRALASAGITSAADQSRIKELENLSPEDTFQPFTDVIHLQDESQYKNGAYTSTEIHDFSGGMREENTAHTTSRVPLTALPSDELKYPDHENVFQVEEKNIQNEYRYDKEELSSAASVSGGDYLPVHAKVPQTVMVS